MQPRSGGFFGFGAPAKPKTDKPGEREVHRNTFGADLPWAIGSVTVGDQTFDKVGIRYKGNGTIGDASRTARKSFKIDLDRHGGSGRFLGSKAINLHSGVADPSRGRETLGYWLYRDAEVPAPRTTLAEVRITVEGKFDNHLLGVYTIVEPVDKAFLRVHFGTGDGLLMKPEGQRDFVYRGDDWARYEKPLAPKRAPNKEEIERFIAFCKLVDKADDAEFNRKISDSLDVEGYLRFLAVTAMQSNLDSFFSLGHNYMLYLHPKTGRFHFFPWDLDRSLANMPFFGTHAQQMDLSLSRPYFGSHRLTERVLSVPGMKEKYNAVLKDIATTCFKRESVLKKISTIESTVKELIEAETKSSAERKEPIGVAGPFGTIKPPTLRMFVERRTESIALQLAGKSKGFVPAGFGAPMRVGDMIAAPLLGNLDKDKDGRISRKEWMANVENVFIASDAEKRGWTDEKSLAAGINRLLTESSKEGAPPKKAALNPGAFMAGHILRRADVDKDGKVTHAEIVSAASILFDLFDKAKAGTLSETTFADMLSELFPFPGVVGVGKKGPEKK